MGKMRSACIAAVLLPIAGCVGNNSEFTVRTKPGGYPADFQISQAGDVNTFLLRHDPHKLYWCARNIYRLRCEASYQLPERDPVTGDAVTYKMNTSHEHQTVSLVSSSGRFYYCTALASNRDEISCIGPSAALKI
ncbi:hypothetical protein FB009_12461 [Sinorhizobium medicae]|nr:hypothetical protein FB009_12461 [Sinorhizobium medicae]